MKLGRASIYLLGIFMYLWPALSNSDTLPPANPSWSEEERRYHAGLQARFVERVRMCEAGNGTGCYYAGQNMYFTGLRFDPNEKSKGDEAISEKARHYYQRALFYARKGCDIAARDPDSSNCANIENFTFVLNRLTNPDGQKRQQQEKVTSLKRVTGAVREYVSRDCSKLGLILNSDFDGTSSLTALLSSFTVVDGLCIVDYGIGETSIGISGVYDLECSEHASRTLQCEFGIYIHCRMTSQFGESTDNARISRAVCASAFPYNYRGSARFTVHENGSRLSTETFDMWPVPLTSH